MLARLVRVSVSCTLLVACSQAETGHDLATGGQGAGGNASHAGTGTNSAGSGNDAGGTSVGAGSGGPSASGSAGEAALGGTTSDGGGGTTSKGGASGAAGTDATGGLFGNDEGKFPTLQLPIELPDTPAPLPCPTGSIISKVAAGALYSWPGTVFGSVAPSGEGQNHTPAKLQVLVSKDGAPVSGCEVRFVAGPGNGWGFGASRVTDAQGKLYGYWTAGKPGSAKISASIALEDGGESHADFDGSVAEHESRTDSVHLYFDAPSSYTEFKVRVTPLSAPAATYYSALNWQDSYAGIQFDGDTTTVIFSVWDAGGEKAKISEQGACNALVGFGGEGTGTSCRLQLPPSKHGKVPGLPDDYRLEVGNTYELHLSMVSSPSGGTAHSLTFTDLTRGIGPISVGTQTTGTAFEGGGRASAFVEEWTPHGSCLETARSVLYHGTRAKVGGAWQDIKSASFNPNYVADNNEVCGNYLATSLESTWLMSSGGTELVGRPFVPGDGAFKKPQPAIVLR